MPQFCCTNCNCVENTGACNYWGRKVDGLPLLCSECDPAIGKWHGRFEKRSAHGMLVDNEGFLWSESSVNAGHLPKHKRIEGVIFLLTVEVILSKDNT